MKTALALIGALGLLSAGEALAHGPGVSGDRDDMPMMGRGMMGQGYQGQMPMMGYGMGMGPGMMMSGQAGTAMSLPERLDWAEKHMTARLEMLQAMKGATTQLYGVLSGEQKGLADRLIHGPMGMM